MCFDPVSESENQIPESVEGLLYGVCGWNAGGFQAILSYY